MTETQRQIKELRKALPGLKEKVLGVAILLCVSLVMVASASYAWVTMSTNPELGGVNTTVAANGALEIALSDFDGEEPEESAVGDSFAAQGQTTHAANTSWGNLVNISNGYGVESLILRPAALDLDSDAYLYGAKYSDDGRVEGSLSDFSFTTWYQTDKNTNTWKFVAPSNYASVYPNGNAYGVRAISSVAYEGQEDINTKKIGTMEALQRQSKNGYYNLTHDPDNIEIIRALVQVYLDKNVDAAVNHVLSGGDGAFEVPDFSLDGKTYIPPMLEMLKDFYYDVILPAGDAIVYEANLQMEAYYNNLVVPEGQEKPTQPENYTLAALLAVEDRSELLNHGIKLTALGYNASKKAYTDDNAFKILHDQVKSDYETALTFKEANGEVKKTIYWSEIEPLVNSLIHIDSLKVQGKTIDQIGGMGTGALSFVNNMPERASVVVYKGTLWSYEDLAGEYMSMDIPVKVYKKVLGIGVDYDGIGVVTTSVPRNKDSRFAKDADSVKTAINAVDTRTIVAQDTYGMILDLWVRTNGENSLLTLNGTPKYNEYEKQRTIIINGETYDVYAYNRYTGLIEEMPIIGKVPQTEEILVYPGTYTDETTGETVDCYYDCATYALITRYDLQDSDNDGVYDKAVDSGELLKSTDKNTQGELMVQPKMDTFKEVVGYESANRIWTDEDFQTQTNNPPLLDPGQISATQGSGSCYIFYADSHEASARALELLANLRLVFLDENGRELSRAFLDVEHVFAESGKYTVPIAISESSTSITNEETGEVTMGICALTKNVPVRISVLVYLDGAQLENEMVMSAEDIIGSLNLQFDSTADLHSIGDEELSREIISLDASLLDGSDLPVQELKFEFDGNPVTVPLRATVDGLSATRVEAAFQRKVSASQGSKLEVIELKDSDNDGFLDAEVTFKSPGTYVLNALIVDGIEYKLPEAITVTIEGFAANSILFDTSSALTTDFSVTRDVSITMAADLKAMPKKVQARFMTEDGRAINADLTQVGNTWSGSATFIKSGTYTLQYLVMDGEYYELSANMQRTFTAYLGLTAEVALERYKTDDAGNLILDEDGNKIIDTLEYDFKRTENIYAFVRIYDDTGKAMKGLGNISLYYKPAGSTLMLNGFSTPLEWNGTEYVGGFPADMPGMFEFGQLSVGGQLITKAKSAPTLTVRSLLPPQFVKSESAEVIIGKGTVYYEAYIKNATAASSWVVLNHGNVDYEVQLLHQGNDIYHAAFPDLDGDAYNDINSNGTWTVKELRFEKVYGDGVYYPADGDSKYIIDIENETYTVVNYLHVVQSDPVLLGATKAEDGTITVTGKFMDSYAAKDYLSVKVSAPIKTSNPTDATACVDTSLYAANVSVAMSLSHVANTMEAHGGYTATEILNKLDMSLTGSQDSDKKVITFTTQDATKLQRAGTYQSSLTVTMGGYTESRTNNKFIEIYSKKPTVTVKAVSPAPGTTFSTTRSSGGAVVEVAGVTNYISENKDHATVFLKGTKGTLGNWSYSVPTVTLKLEGVAAGDAKLTMVNAADPNTTHVFNFPFGTTEVTQQIGKSVGQTGDHDTKYLAGMTMFTEIPIICDGVTYTVQLSKPVTIEQPEAPYVLSFGDLPTAIPADQQPKAVTANGSEVTVYLPKLTWTETTASAPTYTEWTSWSLNRDIRTDYTTYSQKIVIATYTRYNYYIWGEYTRTRDRTGETVGQDMQIATWTINGRTYAAGQTYTIQLSDNAVATANITTVGNPYSMGNTTVTETEVCYGYRAGSTGQSKAPSGGNNLGTASGFSSAPAPKLYPDYTYAGINDWEKAKP